MHIYRHLTHIPALKDGSSIAIGNFDGIHLGHKAVFGKAKSEARRFNVPFIVLTFEPHPIKALRPEIAPARITPFSDKARLASVLDVDGLYVVHFTKNYAKTTPEEFVKNTLVNTLHAKSITVGDDFAFGRGREGSPEALQQLGEKHGFSANIVKAVQSENGEDLSSSRVRKYLLEGDIKSANAMLGRLFSVRVRRGGDISRYAPLKNGEYRAKVSYNDELTKITIKNGKVLSDFSNKVTTIEFLG